MPLFIVVEYALFFICRDPDTIIFQDEIEPLRDFMIRDDKVFKGNPMADSVAGNVNEDVLKERIGINLESFSPEPWRNRSRGKGKNCRFKNLLDSQPGR